ncbi:hypothetical protein [Chryseobacterium lathyri]|uniref:Uncharacterized protein n=1 Tax=Chryseobacterium lathyri TaxID=395933 RepID=A0A511Y8P8_9FLAO|nr:hypothetical protein [Chryseobacterium lathyri]GEN71569.1 hypothetical protein CLA01_16410 [Chryseobacterium lathyri]
MKYIFKFLQTGGVPLTNDLMALIEEAYGIFEVLGDLSGNLTILSGCDITGTNVAPGIVAIEGKLYYFEGGSIISTVYIHKEDIAKTFEDQTTKTLIEKRTVRFGSGAVNYNWSDFVKLQTLKEIQSKVDNSVSRQEFEVALADIELLKLKTAPIVNGGVVWAFGKPVDEIPAGWKECTDIRGKAVVGWDPDDPDFEDIGNSGGSKTILLTVSQLPKIKFQYTRTLPWSSGSGGGFSGGGNQFNIGPSETNELGNNDPINIMIPHFIAAFIEPNLP